MTLLHVREFCSSSNTRKTLDTASWQLTFSKSPWYLQKIPEVSCFLKPISGKKREGNPVAAADGGVGRLTMAASTSLVLLTPASGPDPSFPEQGHRKGFCYDRCCLVYDQPSSAAKMTYASSKATRILPEFRKGAMGIDVGMVRDASKKELISRKGLEKELANSCDQLHRISTDHRRLRWVKDMGMSVGLALVLLIFINKVNRRFMRESHLLCS